VQNKKTPPFPLKCNSFYILIIAAESGIEGEWGEEGKHVVAKGEGSMNTGNPMQTFQAKIEKRKEENTLFHPYVCLVSRRLPASLFYLDLR
jgi:hypothetical protein